MTVSTPYRDDKNFSNIYNKCFNKENVSTPYRDDKNKSLKCKIYINFTVSTPYRDDKNF